ncbi:MAG: DNA repair protein RadC [Alphaproteobacteria bacterium]
MPDKTSDFRNGHRQRLRDKFTESPHITDAELLELLLTYAIPRIDVKPIVRALINKFGSYGKIIAASKEELLRIPGVGPNVATYIKALHAGTLRDYVSSMKDSPVFHKYEILENYCKMTLADKNIEEFHVIYLDKNNQLIQDDAHSVGTVDHAVAYPREILKRALELNACHVILLHNHPSGSPIFSSDDIRITKAVQTILKNVDINLHDHLLVADGKVFSAKAMNFI